MKSPQTLNECIADSVEKTIEFINLSKTLKGKELSILVTDNLTIKSINKQTREKDQATNVLSFPFMGFDRGSLIDSPMPQPILGEIVLSIEKLCQEAEEQKKELVNHLRHLIIHSVLHLLGYDHQEDCSAKEMESLEVEILNKYFDINDPYI